MVGLERTVLPLIAQADFGLVSKTAVLSFLISFGVVKALAPLRRPARRPDRTQAAPGRGLARRAPGAAAHHLGAELGLGRPRQRAVGRQPGAVLVHDGDHEDRSRRAGAARLGDGAE